MNMRTKIIAAVFWVGILGFIVLDRGLSVAHDRFAEPPAFALGSGKVAGAGHCSGGTR